MAAKLPVRICIIGCGAAVEHLYVNPLRRLARSGWVRVVGLADPSERRRGWAVRVFPDARVFAEAAPMLGETKADLTVITSPPPLHADHAEIALALGSHVLCEKPLADTVLAGGRMLASAHTQKRLLGVGMTRRYYPCLAEARRWLQQGRLGRVHSYTYREGGVYAWPVTSDGPFRRASSGGGVLLDKGVHVLDFLCWLFGAGRLIRSEDDAWRDGVEGNSVLQLDHHGVSGRVQLSWDQDLNNGFVIRGDLGELMMPVGPLRDLFFRTQGNRWSPVPTDVRWPADLEASGGRRGQPRTYYECFDYQLVQMLRALVHGEPVPVTGEEGLDILTLIEHSYTQATALTQPWLPPDEKELAGKNHWHA